MKSWLARLAGVLLVATGWAADGQAPLVHRPRADPYDVSISDPVWHDGVLLMSTPLCRDGHVYALDRKDGQECIELRTGKVKWRGEHVTPRGTNPQASLVWAGPGR